jgi:hypothetical protein
MTKKDMDNDQLIEEFDDEGDLSYDQGEELDFSGEDELDLEEGEEEDLIPSVLYKGVSRPKTEDDWRQLLMEASRDGVPEYHYTDSYKDGDLIIHSQFGLGVVSKVISPKKMEVVFDTSKKLMAMNLTPPQ